jgi:hypothetical protein
MTIGGTTEVAAPVEHAVAIPRARRATPEIGPKPPVSEPAPERPGPPAPPEADLPSRCRCGHPVAAHEHFRPGSDCGACGATQCGRYRPAARHRGPLAALRRAIRRAR